MTKKALPIGSCLSTLLDDSNRMMPFMGTIIYNLETRSSCSHYLRHLISTYTNGSRSKKCFIATFENSFHPQRFLHRNGIISNDNIVVFDDLQIDLEALKSLGNKSSGFKTDNVLIIDSLIPLLLSSDDDCEKIIHDIMISLRKLQSFYAQIIVLHSNDTFFIPERSLEQCLKQISNSILDFRRESGLDSGVICQLNDSSIHVHITVKKKHPRTHLKVSSQHEHFLINSQTNKIIKYLSGPQVNKMIEKKFEPNEKSVQPELSIEKLVPFSLSLKDSEQKAKDDLILPYMRKQENPNQNKQEEETKSSSGGQVIYHYDKFDDFDEDDPDDDLDF